MTPSVPRRIGIWGYPGGSDVAGDLWRNARATGDGKEFLERSSWVSSAVITLVPRFSAICPVPGWSQCWFHSLCWCPNLRQASQLP